MKRWAVVVAAALAMGGIAAMDAAGAGECEGLDVCISVPGPWVVVPAAGGGERVRRVEYQLTCPAGSVVAGLDAVRGHTTIDVVFLGALGSPVNPGVTTGRSVVFVATYAGRTPSYFRPFVGCLPTSGGGRETTSVAPAAPRPPVRRVGTLRVRAGAARTLVARCAPGERLVASSHAVGFRRRAAPSAEMLTAVSVSRRNGEDRVSVEARRSSAVPARVRVEVQVHALCWRQP